MPTDLLLASVEVPDEIIRDKVDVSFLPANWRDPGRPRELTAIGDRFVLEGKSAVLLVPSIHAEQEWNWLLNPAHPDFGRIRLMNIEPFAYDSRLMGRMREKN